jgi:glycosyltransferase involved in cell wall biosynthesis
VSTAIGDLVEIVVVPRELYNPTPACMAKLVQSVPSDVAITLVQGGMPDKVLRSLTTHGDRIRIVGPRRHLAPNAARNIGLTHTSAPYVVFIDNDVETQPGWIEPLVRLAQETGATAVRPITLQRFGDSVTVHEAGGDCHLEYEADTVTLVENHRLSRAPVSATASLVSAPVEMFEFHCVLFDRLRLLALGGPDEHMKSQGDHLDLALRIQNDGGSVWLAADSTVTYVVPSKLAITDMPFFLGRWSPSWNQQSHAAFAARHGQVDYQQLTWQYGDLHRTYAWRPWFRLLGKGTRVLTQRDPTARLSIIFDRAIGAHLAGLILRMSPRWRGDGVS